MDNETNKNQIVFIEGYNTAMIYKIAKLLKKRGYETVLIRLLEQNSADKAFYNKAFDKVIDFNIPYSKLNKKNFFKIFFSFSKKIQNIFFSLIKLFKLKPYVIIGRAPLSFPVAVFRILFFKTPFVYFPYDIRSQAIPTFEEGRKNLPFFEIKADRFCFEHSDGLMHKGAPNELDYLNGRMLGDNIRLPKSIINFHPYCSKEFIVPLNKNKLSKKDKEIHFVYVGGPLNPNKEFYFQQLDDFKELVKQKMHIHFYFSSGISKNRDIKEEEKIKASFMEAYKDFPGIDYFHIEGSFNAKDIVKEISKYDFGVSPYTSIAEIHDLAIKFCIGNKLSTYLEAGIPFIYHKDLEFMDKIMESYGIKLNWPDSRKEIKKYVKKLDYQKIIKNLLKARKDFLMEKHLPRFEKFLKEVAENRK